MPELTVAMPAYNVGPYIQQAMTSVLQQEGVDLELIVVDDASTDDTARVVASCADPRVRLLRNRRRQGIGYCHNVVLRESRAPYLSHVDADDFLMPGALRKLVDAVAGDPSVGQSHCYFFDIDEQGRTTREALHERFAKFRRTRPPTLDYRAAVQQASGVINTLRTYRRAVLEELGGFNEELRFGVDYEMALRLLDRYGIKLVPEFLYVRRVHPGSTTESLAFKRSRFWLQNYLIRRQVVRQGKVRFLDRATPNWPRLFRLYVGDPWTRERRRLAAGLRRVGARLRWRVLAPAAAGLPQWLGRHLSWWPIEWFPAREPAAGGRRLAYHVRAFPVLSETFIQREIAALRRAGALVEVFADEARDVSHYDEQAAALQASTHYLDAVEPQRVAAYVRRFRRRRPLAFANLFLYTLLAPRAAKSLSADRLLFRRAVLLAGLLQDAGIDHVHTPWADNAAFVAMLAATLLRIPYSVQARASEIYRTPHPRALAVKLARARFVVTNAHYNSALLRSLLPPSQAGKVHTIYEGIVPEQFPSTDPAPPDGMLRLLAVGRLVEQKGFECLLLACRLLKDRAVPFSCTIIGGRIPKSINDYLSLTRRRRALGLETEVAFVGAQPFPRVWSAYREADVFVLPSVVAGNGARDVTPNVLIEAMAVGLPVISTTLSAIPELVENEVSGLLVPPRDPEMLTEAILRLGRDQTLRRRLAENARRRVEERFDIDRNIARYAELFRGQPRA